VVTAGGAVLVVNTGARSGPAAFLAAQQCFTELGLHLDGAHDVHNPADLLKVVDEAIAAGVRLLVLGGGDGTVSLVASRLARTQVVLGLLPLGTANDLARTLGLPTDLAAACDRVVNGTEVTVDLGIVGDDAFVNVASVGLSVGVTQALSPRLKRVIGPLAYPVAAVAAYWRHRPFRARLEFPLGDHPAVSLDDLLQVAVANGRFYGGGNVAAPEAAIDDQLLDVYAIPRGTARQRWEVARHFVSGAFVESDHVLHVTTRAVRLVTEPELVINVDGELTGATPELFGVLSRGLRVMS
jgi:YegS/Rv2252/BmrU family lipid kinase